MAKKILLVADQPGWIFERHCQEIQKRLSHKFEIGITYRKANIPELSKSFDLVYVLDPIPLRKGYPPPEKTIIGMRNEFLYREHPNGPKGLYENGFQGRCASIKDKCCIYHVVNQRLMEVFKDIVEKPLLLVRHGVDTNIFDINKREFKYLPIDGKLKVSVSGRGTANKGFNLVQEACKRSGVEIITAEYSKRLTHREMPYFYAKADVHVCMSRDEGLNNPLMESGAMGLAPISTRSGAATEMIEDGVSGFLIDRDVDSLVGVLDKMKEDSIRIPMAKKFHEEIISNWSWDVLIKEYEIMFDLYFEEIQ